MSRIFLFTCLKDNLLTKEKKMQPHVQSYETKKPLSYIHSNLYIYIYILLEPTSIDNYTEYRPCCVIISLRIDDYNVQFVEDIVFND